MPNLLKNLLLITILVTLLFAVPYKVFEMTNASYKEDIRQVASDVTLEVKTIDDKPADHVTIAYTHGGHQVLDDLKLNGGIAHLVADNHLTRSEQAQIKASAGVRVNLTAAKKVYIKDGQTVEQIPLELE